MTMTTPGNVRSYRLDPAAFESTIRRRVLRRLAWLAPFSLLVGAIMWLAIAAARDELAETLREPTTLAISIAVFVGTMVVANFQGFRLALQIEKPRWDAYELVVSANVLRRFTVETRPVEILRDEVTRITETRGTGLTVATSDGRRSIDIPEQLIGFDDVRAQLATWRAFERPRSARQAVTAFGSPLLVLGASLTSLVVADIRLAAAALVLLLAIAAFHIRVTLTTDVPRAKHGSLAVGLMALSFSIAPVLRLVGLFVGGVG